MPRTKKKLLSIPLAIALCTLTIGLLFSVQHWRFGVEINLISWLAIGVLYTIRYASKNPINVKDTFKVIMVITWVFLNVYAMFKPYDLLFVRIILVASVAGWFVLEMRDIITKKPKWERANLPQMIGISIVIFHLVFRLQHWPGLVILYLLSLFAPILMAIGFIISSKRSNE